MEIIPFTNTDAYTIDIVQHNTCDSHISINLYTFNSPPFVLLSGTPTVYSLKRYNI